MKINNKYIIGTHIMFFEITMVKEQTQSLINAINTVENKENITIDYFFNISEYFEKIDTNQKSKQELIDLFEEEIVKLKETGCNVNSKVYDGDKPITMVDYRRDLNYYGCQDNDYVIWGESDCLLPRELFYSLEQIKTYANQNNIHKFITTFGIRKMWDANWEPLEHPDFTNETYYEMDDDRAYTSPHSIRYTMSIDEMNTVNEKVDQIDLRVLNRPQFDGSCLILSSDLIKNGVNIPHGIIGLIAEDTSIMHACHHLLGNNYVQFVVKNILKVHNRNHPLKRLYALDMDKKTKLSDFSKGGKKGSWFEEMRKICNHNISTFGQNQNKFATWKDYESLVASDRKNVIYLIKVGDVDYSKHTLPLIQNYAERCDADVVIFDENKFDVEKHKHPNFLLFDIFKHFKESSYEKMLYMDLDIRIMNNAENIFDKVESFGMVQDHTADSWRRAKMQEWLDKHHNGMTINHYFNGGVLVSDKNSINKVIEALPKNILEFWETTKDMFPHGFNQNILNYSIIKSGINYKELPDRWNKVCRKADGNDYFIHYVANKNQIQTDKDKFKDNVCDPNITMSL